ncbi:short-chain alcohol dehydrogenase [Guyanagaster necrorhizus]|uniref:Short-chain alcohol dehydrogenase n=1 Tax=Guyanagaster necrorhizus TaxID=856835 RepID=A0A9P8AYK9_9AGAR|nr:short-chain alcohol dehydrogenase [Guyanagaster necrorhizus MCA 3950]KAG7452331.1 short-chain alcohol dehydrogenase [Guyanagaster necrorhizus MCA 3950]
MSNVKTIFITGTSSGIGLATAKLFHAKGWNVVGTLRDTSQENPLKSLDPSRVLLVQMDVADPSSISPAIEAAIEKFSKVDLLVNSAGYGQSGIFEMLSPEQVRRQFDVNVFGVMDVIRTFLPHLRIEGGGIINISSGAGVFTLPMLSMYCASKFALEGFTEALSYELASQNIFVKSVIPHGGVTSTNFNATSAALTPMDLSKAPSYAAYAMKTANVYKKMSAAPMISSDNVADMIYAAATDETDRLRYFVGNDTRGFIKARYESSSDGEYVKHMRSFFA